MKKLLTIVAIATMLVSCGGGKQGKPDFSDNVYAVRTVGTANANIETTYPATLKGVQDVEIRPKVAGFITKIYVTEGQKVSAGQALFDIDNATYKAAVNQARAGVVAAEAQANTAKLTYENSQKLFANNIIGDFELQSAKSRYEAAVASLGQAKAALASAEETLSYCHITAPASGYVGVLPYDPGALVSSSSQQPLTTISDGSEIEAYFSLTEKEMLDLTRKFGSVQAGISSLPSVKLQLADGTIYESEGKVTKGSGVVDPVTGSICMIAVFPNERQLLKSGGSARIVMPYVASDAIIIPQDATVEVQDKHFVYIVGKDNKVKYTEVSIDTQNDGQNYIITGGLKKGDRIVVNGVNSLQEGMEIKPVTEAEYAKKLKKAEELGKIQDQGVIAVGKALQG